MNSKEFSLIIEGVVKDKKPITYMDAIMDYCHKNDLEIESAAKLINQKIKKELKEEAITLNFMKDEEHI